MSSSPSPDGKAAAPSPRRPPVDSGVSPPASADGKAAAPPAVAAPAPASTSPRRLLQALKRRRATMSPSAWFRRTWRGRRRGPDGARVRGVRVLARGRAGPRPARGERPDGTAAPGRGAGRRGGSRGTDAAAAADRSPRRPAKLVVVEASGDADAAAETGSPRSRPPRRRTIGAPRGRRRTSVPPCSPWRAPVLAAPRTTRAVRGGGRRGRRLRELDGRWTG